MSAQLEERLETSPVRIMSHVPSEALPVYTPPTDPGIYEVPTQAGTNLTPEIPVIARRWNEFWAQVEI